MRKLWTTIGVLAAAFAGGAVMQFLMCSAQTAYGQQPTAPRAPEGALRANSLVLVDEQGRERVRLQATAGSPVGIVVLDDKGKPMAEVGEFAAGTGLQVWANGARAIFGSQKDSPGVGAGIWSAKNALRFGIGYEPAGNGGFVFNDENGKERVGMGMPARGGYSASMKDEQGATVWQAP